jgi:FtsH-binding integral membrane protein
MIINLVVIVLSQSMLAVNIALVGIAVLLISLGYEISRVVKLERHKKLEREQIRKALAIISDLKNHLH